MNFTKLTETLYLKWNVELWWVRRVKIVVCKLCFPHSKADDIHDVKTAYGTIMTMSHNSLACFRHVVVYDLSPLALWYWCNIHVQLFSFRIRCLSQWYRTISVLNRNLQQVEMWFCRVYFHHCNTTRSTVHAYYVILSKKFPPLEDLALVSIIQTNLPPTSLGCW